MRYESNFDQAAAALGHELSNIIGKLDGKIKSGAQEIRIRAGRPVCVTERHGQRQLGGEEVAPRQVENAFVSLCGHSVYSHLSELSEGFITVEGGHRAAFGGSAVVDGGRVSSMRDISSINLRIAREVTGCASALIEDAFGSGVKGLLLCGPPGSGKTTLLRDVARSLSMRRMRVTVVDERGELAAGHNGRPQLDIGPCTDLLSGFPKGVGITQAVRCLSPEVIICDEIGGAEEAEAVAQSVNTGVAIIASAHAANLAGLLSRKSIRELLSTGAFGKIAFLSTSQTPSTVTKIIDWEEAPA